MLIRILPSTALQEYTGLLNNSVKNFSPILCRYSAIHANPDVPTGMSEVLDQLQQDLSKKNMFFSKDSIETFKVIGEGVNII